MRRKWEMCTEFWLSSLKQLLDLQNVTNEVLTDFWRETSSSIEMCRAYEKLCEITV